MAIKIAALPHDSIQIPDVGGSQIVESYFVGFPRGRGGEPEVYSVWQNGTVKLLVAAGSKQPGSLGRRFFKVCGGPRADKQQLAVWVLAAVEGWPEGKLEASHINGDHCDNRVANLCWETPAENHARTVAHGTSAAGERNPNSALTESDVLEIRDLCPDGRANAGRDRGAFRNQQRVQ